MTNRYEDALNDMPENDGSEDPFHWVCDNYETIRSALKLAQETEQLKAQREAFKAKMDAFLEEDITRTKTVDGATVGFIYRDELVEQLRLKLSETAIHLAARNSEIEQLRKEAKRLVRENEVFAERHKAWESCVYTVGLPVIRDVRDTEYGDAVPPVPVVNKVTDLLDECNKIRKERDEFAHAIIKIHEDQEGDYDFLKFISHPQYILAKKVVGE